MALVSYSDLTAPSKSDPSQRVIDVVVARMQSASEPMPPAPLARAASSEIATLRAWIASGLPTGSCGSSAGAAVDGASDPYGTPTVCTSNTTWTRHNNGSALMHPGKACISCHASGEGPKLSIAGTIYPTAHEPDDCYGEDSAQVLITDATGRTLMLAPNAAGNFYYQGSIATPFHAKVVRNGVERAMASAQTTGDCNRCHTLQGDQGAPGRVVAP
jgi:hypothetical protein